MTPRSGNTAKWMGENVEEIMQDSQDLAIEEEERLFGKINVH